MGFLRPRCERMEIAWKVEQDCYGGDEMASVIAAALSEGFYSAPPDRSLPRYIALRDYFYSGFGGFSGFSRLLVALAVGRCHRNVARPGLGDNRDFCTV
jgi:hypothetical protein